MKQVTLVTWAVVGLFGFLLNAFWYPGSGLGMMWLAAWISSYVHILFWDKVTKDEKDEDNQMEVTA